MEGRWRGDGGEGIVLTPFSAASGDVNCDKRIIAASLAPP